MDAMQDRPRRYEADRSASLDEIRISTRRPGTLFSHFTAERQEMLLSEPIKSGFVTCLGSA
jgi:hypothetical protein